jgi:hypothetical protein
MSMDTIYTTFILLLIVLSFSIGFSLYLRNNKENYHENYLSHYYKLKNMPIIIPHEFREPNYESKGEYDFNDEEEDENDNNYKKDVIEFPVLFNYNGNDKNLNFCYSLLAEFIFCLSPDNENNPKCENLIFEKSNELKRCDIINLNNLKKLKNYKNLDVLLPKDEETTEKQTELKLDQKLNLIKEKIEDNEQKNKNNKSTIKNETIKEKINGNKDCIEYGLTQDEHIICTKYE